MPIKKRPGKTEYCMVRTFQWAELEGNMLRVTLDMSRQYLRINGGKGLVNGEWHEAEAVDPNKRGGIKYDVWVEIP